MPIPCIPSSRAFEMHLRQTTRTDDEREDESELWVAASHIIEGSLAGFVMVLTHLTEGEEELSSNTPCDALSVHLCDRNRN